jgi:peptide-methionine (S)-S-oxide reductase
MLITKIGFGGSCHWCTEAIFASLNGVEKVDQGWISADGENDGFSEAVIVHFDDTIISLKALIEVHLHTHSCTAQHSMRKKYRSAVYYFTSLQGIEEQVNESLKQFQEDFDNKIITKVLPVVNFKLNHASFLDYYYSNPEKPFCENVINPKLKLLLSKFPKHSNQTKLYHLKEGGIKHLKWKAHVF